MKENGFTLKKARSKQYPTQTITDANYADEIAQLSNSTAQTESQLHSLEKAAGSIDLHVNTDKTEYMYFKIKQEISLPEQVAPWN